MSQRIAKTEKEIDAIVVSQADDPTAWEAEAHVKPRRWRVGPSTPRRVTEGEPDGND
jgi:hypothetical protein